MGHYYYYYVRMGTRQAPREGYRPRGSRKGQMEGLTNSHIQYELNGTVEVHDPSVPSTNSCPYLPGQTVNAMWVPVEHTSRARSASVNSAREHDFRTMNPDAKFLKPRPAPSPPQTPPLAAARVSTAPAPAQVKRRPSARSLSPASGWALSRRMFSRKTSSSSLKEDIGRPIMAEDERSIVSLEGSRSRDISPECLRRFLSDAEPFPTADVESETSERPVIAIPEDIVEENEDDDNFAVLSPSESNLYTTALSPPPSQRSLSPARPSTISISQDQREESVTPRFVQAPSSPPPPPPVAAPLLAPTSSVSRLPRLEQLDLAQLHEPRSHFSLDSSLYSPSSPKSPDSTSLPSFCHSDNDDDDDEPSPSIREGEGAASSAVAIQRNVEASLSTYSLPQSRIGAKQTLSDGNATTVAASVPPFGSPAVVARNGTDVPVGTTSLLASPVPDSGLDDLVNELGWIADVIGKASVI